MFGLNIHNQNDLTSIDNSNIKTIELGYVHSGIIYKNNSMILFGNNKMGQCDYTRIESEYIVMMSLGGGHTGILTNLNNLNVLILDARQRIIQI